MRRALYDAERGYYRKPRDPFGKDGDFFTASQLQPLFGQLIAAEAHALCPGEPVWELGPGRGEMAGAFRTAYRGIDYTDAFPTELRGFVFANEFLDALPVRLGTMHDGQFYECMVDGGKLVRGARLDAEASAYVERYWPFIAEDGRFEIAFETLSWIDRIAQSIRSDHPRSGYALLIDYGYTTAETARFPQGTLMSYRRHRATPLVLENPGEQDITAHVPFDAVMDRAAAGGLETVRMETLAQLVLRCVEREPSLISTPIAKKQCKTLMFGMGETFRCVLFRKAGANAV